jgi:hypothetical protein
MKKPARNNPISSSRGQRGLLILLAVLISLVFVFYILVGSGLLPGDMVLLPTLATTTRQTTTTETTEPPVVDNPILITEIMSSNRTILQDGAGTSPDWIEFYNQGTSPVNLKDYGLSDNLKKPTAWTFPAVVIEPGAYLIVFASGLTEQADIDAALARNEIHTNFKLAQSGDDLIFTSSAGHILARLSLPEIPTDISYGLLPGARSAEDPYYFFGEPTPGGPNGPDGQIKADDARPVIVCDLVVNEYVTRNTSRIDPDGDYPDWVELYNAGAEPFRLLGCFLSDDPDDLAQWALPDITLAPGAFLLIWLSGKERPYDPAEPANLHATFRLGPEDEALFLSDPHGRLLISQEIEYLPQNVSLGRAPDGSDTWLYFPSPTPGLANTTQGFAELTGAMQLSNRGVWINEAAALSATLTTKGKTDGADWIELYNGSGQAVDLSGYGLSDRRDQPYLELLDGIVLQPGGFAVIEPQQFGISTSGETLYLTDPDRELVDWFETGGLRNGMSSGRGDTGGLEPADSRFFYETPTRGKANTTLASLGYALEPVITAVRQDNGEPVDGLYLDAPVLVSLTSSQPDAVIRYTLDGSVPGSRSLVYSEPLLISQTAVIRCLAERDYGLPSQTICRTFLAGVRHDLPVVSILGNPADFFDPVKGLWTNYQARIEQPADIDYYEADGTPGIQFSVGVNLHGSYSRTELQKSMELKLRTAYGDSQVIYPFFPGNEVSTFKRLILRTSGQDWQFTKLRDAFMTKVIAADSAQDTMDVRPCVVYINGKYFGLYEIREKVDQYYMAAHHGADPDNVDIIKGNKIMLSGTYDAYGALLQYVRNNDMRNETAYQYVLSQIDEHSLMDFIITQTFFNNLDSGNKKFWRERSDSGEWRWVFFDLDWAMFPSTYKINILKYDLLDPAGHGQQNIFSTTLQVRLMQNPAFERAFIERYAWFLNNVFQTERMLAILDEMTEQIRSEMPRQIARWGKPSTVAAWEYNVSELRRITSEKRGRMLIILQESFNLSSARMRELFPEDYR